MEVDKVKRNLVVRPEELEVNGCIKSIIKDDFYPGIEVFGLSPRWYFNQKFHTIDEYSEKIISAKKLCNEKDYFWSYIEKTIDLFENYSSFLPVDLITIIPNSKGNYFKIQIELIKLIALKLKAKNLFLFDRIPGRRKGNAREERYNDIHEKFKIINEEGIKNKRVLIFDDIRTSGISILECTTVLLNAGAKDVVALTLGTHTSKAPSEGKSE